jgi:hypothetical protein
MVIKKAAKKELKVKPKRGRAEKFAKKFYSKHGKLMSKLAYA